MSGGRRLEVVLASRDATPDLLRVVAGTGDTLRVRSVRYEAGPGGPPTLTLGVVRPPADFRVAAEIVEEG